MLDLPADRIDLVLLEDRRVRRGLPLEDDVEDRVQELTGLQVDEVHIVVSDLATDITPPPRVH